MALDWIKGVNERTAEIGDTRFWIVALILADCPDGTPLWGYRVFVNETHARTFSSDTDAIAYCEAYPCERRI